MKKVQAFLQKKKLKHIAAILAVSITTSSLICPAISFAADSGNKTVTDTNNYEQYNNIINEQVQAAQEELKRTEEINNESGSGGGNNTLNKVVEYASKGYEVYNTVKNINDAVKSADAVTKTATEVVNHADTVNQALDSAHSAGSVATGWDAAGAAIGGASALYGLATGDVKDVGSTANSLGSLANTAKSFGWEAGGQVADALGYVGSVFGQKLSETVTYRSAVSKAKVTCQTDSPYPTANEKITINCAAVPTSGAHFVVPPAWSFTDTPENAKKKMQGMYFQPWKCGKHGCYPVGGGVAEVEYKAYDGETTMGGDMYFGNNNGFSYKYESIENSGLKMDGDIVSTQSTGIDFGNTPQQGTGSIIDSIQGYYSTGEGIKYGGYEGGEINYGGYTGINGEGYTYGVNNGEGYTYTGYTGTTGEGYSYGGYTGINGEGYSYGGVNGEGYSYGGVNGEGYSYGGTGNGAGLTGSGEAFDWSNSGYSGDINSAYRDNSDSFNADASDWSSSTGGIEGGYYDSNGDWRNGTNPYEGGHYNSNGDWVNGETGSTGGYMDANGNWHEGSPYGSDTLDDYFNSKEGISFGGDSANGTNGISGIDGLSTDIMGMNPSADKATALSVLANGGYVGSDGMIYDAEGNVWGSAVAAGLIAMEEGSDQLNNVLAQGGRVENGIVYDANGNIVGYTVPAGSLSNIEKEAFEDDSMFAQAEAMLQEFLNSLGNSNGGDASLMDRLTSAAKGGVWDTLKATFGLASAEDVKKETMTPQQMYDMAAKILKELGYSDEDIVKGRNYDANSAYSEPEKAWDLNRITTMQKNFKIDTGIRIPKKASSMMKAAGNFSAINGADSQKKSK